MPTASSRQQLFSVQTMGRNRKTTSDLDRYLLCLKGNYTYRRRVPTEIRDVDERGHTVKVSLGTNDVARARVLRDMYEAADDELWASMIAGDDAQLAHEQYQAAVQRAKAMGFLYKPAMKGLANRRSQLLARRRSEKKT